MDFGSISIPLFLVFLVLKLANVTAIAGWSWIWVTSPLWISAGAGIVVLIIAFILSLAGISVWQWIQRRNDF